MWKSFVFGLFLGKLLTSCAAGSGEDFACELTASAHQHE